MIRSKSSLRRTLNVECGGPLLDSGHPRSVASQTLCFPKPPKPVADLEDARAIEKAYLTTIKTHLPRRSPSPRLLVGVRLAGRLTTVRASHTAATCELKKAPRFWHTTPALQHSSTPATQPELQPRKSWTVQQRWHPNRSCSCLVGRFCALFSQFPLSTGSHQHLPHTRPTTARFTEPGLDPSQVLSFPTIPVASAIHG